MKPFKILGLAVVAALMAMALVGTSSATAETTALCKVDESECAAGNLVTHVHEETLTGNQGLLLDSLGNVKCTVLFLSTSVGIPSTPLIVKGNFTYTGCKRKKLIGEEDCTVTEQNGPAEIKLTKTGTEIAKVTGKGEVKVACGSFIECVYNGEGLEATAKGALASAETNGEVSISEQSTHKVSGSLCPAEARLDLKLTPLPDPIYITEAPLKMVCLKLKEKTGLYLSSGNGQTCTSDSAERVGLYELAEVLPNRNSGEMACGKVGSGFFLDSGNGNECQVEDNERKGIYELGTVS
jgi:hypothetical protein